MYNFFSFSQFSQLGIRYLRNHHSGQRGKRCTVL